MADDPNPGAPQNVVIPVSDTSHAPFIFFEAAPAFGIANGVVNLTLSAHRTWIGQDGKIINDHVVVAYLRGNIPAVMGLRQAIDSALLLAAPPAQGSEGRSN